MSRTFTKLFSSITESTVWCEPDRTRLVWIAMLAMADHAGRVWSSVPGLANRARVPLEDVEIALTTFLSPDAYSRTPDHEGRRIEPIDGGWRLLNHAKYRQIRDEESIKESKRRYINERRAAEKAEGVEKSRTESNAVDRGRANAESDAEAEAEAEKEKSKAIQPDGCPHADIIALYHETLPANPRIKSWTGKRQNHLRARWREDDKRQNLDYWRRLFSHVAASPFLTGQRTGRDGRAFLPGLDWLVQPENFAKVIEGRYHEREAVL